MISEQVADFIIKAPTYHGLGRINYSHDVTQYTEKVNSNRLSVARLRHLYYYTKSEIILERFLKKANIKELLYMARISSHERIIDKFIERDKSEHYVRYGTFVGDNDRIKKALARHLDDPERLYEYCRRVKDDPIIWKALAKSTHPEAYKWQYQYYINVKPRQEILDVLLKSYDAMVLLAQYCSDKKRDIPIIRKAIAKHRNPQAIYYYCRYIKDTKDLWQGLKDCSNPEILYSYLRYVANRPELVRALARLRDRSPRYLYWYLKEVEDNEIVWKALAKSKHELAAEYKAKYCSHIKDREEMWRALITHAKKDALWLVNYCHLVKDREEVWRELIRVKSPYTSLAIVRYCEWVKDRKELWKELASRPRAAWEQSIYITDVMYRHEMVQAIINSKSGYKESALDRLRRIRGIIVLEDVYDYRDQLCS